MAVKQRPLYGTYVFNQAIYRKSPEAFTADVVHASYGHPTIRFFDRDDNFIAQIDPGVSHPMESMKCFVMEHGCGSFDMVMNEKLEDFFGTRITQADGVHLFRVDLHLFGEYRPAYRGWIYEVPFQSKDRKYKYRGYGLLEHLKSIILYDSAAGSTGGRKDWIATDVYDIVIWVLGQLAGGVTPKTAVVNDDSYIQDPGYTVAQYQIDHDKSDKVLDDLAKISTGWEWYIDTWNYLHFLEDSTLEQKVLVEGIDMESFTLKKDYRKIKNVFHVKVGEIDTAALADTNFLKHGKDIFVFDQNSVDDYGFREVVLNAPGIFDIDAAGEADDAWRGIGPDFKGWAAAQAAVLSEPSVSAKLTNVQLTQTFPALGNIRVMAAMPETWEDEAAEYDLEIKKITYSLSGSLGLKTDIDLGEIEQQLTDELLEILRRIQNAEIQQSMTVFQTV